MPGISDQLKKAVADSGLSLNQLAKAAGVSTPQLSRFMRGERDMTLAVAAKVAAALGLHLVPK